MTRSISLIKIFASLLLLPISLVYSQTWAPLGSGIGGFTDFSTYVYSLVSSGDRLYAAGYFTTAGGVTANCLASWDGSQWYPYPPGLSQAGMDRASYQIMSLAFYNGRLWAGGNFDSIGGVRARAIATYDDSVWRPAAAGLTHGAINAMVVLAGELFVTGGFDSLEGFFAGGIARWNGAYWSPVGSGSEYRGGTAMLAYLNELYVAGGRGARKWDGTNWTDMSAGLGLGHYVASLAVYRNRLYLSTADVYLPNTIMVWNDSSWTPIVTPRRSIFCGGLAVYKDRLYAGGNFDSSSGVSPKNGIASWDGSSWSSVGGGEIGGILTLKVHNNELYAGGVFLTAGGDSVFRVAKLSMPTDVREPSTGEPKTYVLEQNYPNPFNPSTMIEYSQPASSHVRVEVFDILGNPVKTLVDDDQHAGIHRTPFRADGLPTGVYYYRIKTSGFLQTKRMLLLK